jgi:serine/threonine protein kinase
MERMHAPLFDALPQLVVASTKTVKLGDVCSKLIDIVEEFHKTGHVLLDVKPDNLMVCRTNGGKVTSESLAASIRLVDLGLVKAFGGPHGHKDNTGAAGVQGTPLYASLNVHDLQTSSRRDDMEAMLYLIGDLVLNVMGIANDMEPCYGHGETASFLPWSQESSDAAIGKVKQAHVTDLESAYYRNMPEPAAATLFAAFQVVREYKYAATPNYETFRRLLQPLQVKLPAKRTSKAASRSKAASPLRSAAAKAPRLPRRTPGSCPSPPQSGRRATRSSAEAALDDSPSPPKVAKTTARYKVVDSDFESDVSMEDATEDMEVEDMMVDEEDSRKPAATKNVCGLQLKVKGEGFTETVKLVQGGTESIVLGSKPSNKNGAALQLRDPTLEASHLRLTLSKIHNGVIVVPLSKKCAVQVNRMNVPPSGTTAFVGQSISLGANLVEVQHLRKGELAVESDENRKPAAKKKKTADSDKAEPSTSLEHARTRRSSRTTCAMAMADDNVAEPPSTKQKTPAKAKDRPRAIVKIASGPLGGGEFVLEQGICDTIVIGSAPTRKGHPLTLMDSSVAPNHTCLDLQVKDGVVMVKVTDLKSASGTIFNGKRMASGKTDMAFCGASSIQVGTTVLEMLRG